MIIKPLPFLIGNSSSAYFSHKLITLRPMNSTVVGTTPEARIAGTDLIASFKVGKGIIALIDLRGFGYNLNVTSVTTPSVPSEPIIKSFRE